jgi:hypothetical protein
MTTKVQGKLRVALAKVITYFNGYALRSIFVIIWSGRAFCKDVSPATSLSRTRSKMVPDALRIEVLEMMDTPPIRSTINTSVGKH